MDEMVIRAARRASVDPHFLAFALQQYAENQQMDELALMAALGATPETLAHARLCRTPRTDDNGMREDVDCIAAKFGLNAAMLMQAVRDRQSTAVIEKATTEPLPEGMTWMLAARDRKDEPPTNSAPQGAGE